MSKLKPTVGQVTSCIQNTQLSLTLQVQGQVPSQVQGQLESQMMGENVSHLSIHIVKYQVDR